ncbi:MAG: hypothetical protein QW175_07655 [Candidatus Bathyarchaeia archaeon]
MKTIKLDTWVFDKNKVFLTKGRFDADSNILTVKYRSGFRAVPMRFIVDPSHIYSVVSKKNRSVVFVDVSNRRSIQIPKLMVKRVTVEVDGKKVNEAKTETVMENVEIDGESVQMHSNDDPDMELANKLDYHTERAFWRGLIQSTKLALSTLLITMFAGYGVIRFIEWILTAVFRK